MTKARLFLVLGLFLPTLVLGGIVLDQEVSLARAKVWRVGITGYDPRNLLYGHYLSFRFDWTVPPRLENQAETDDFLCFNPAPSSVRAGEPPVPVLSSVPRSSATTACFSFVSNFKNDRRSGINRRISGVESYMYFIPEDSASRLDSLLRNRKIKMAVDVRISSKGRLLLGDLLIEGLPWKTWLDQHPIASEESTPSHGPQAQSLAVSPPPSLPKNTEKGTP